MADEVTLPGVGRTSRQTIYIAGAAGAGIIGYAWWKRRQNAPVTATENVNDAVGATAYTGAANVAGATGNATVNAGVPSNAILTNSDWTQHATAYLEQNGGMDPSAVSVALGKYLTRDPRGLTDNEVSMVQAARGAFGDPPTGGPYQIIHALPSTGGTGDTTPPLPTGGINGGLRYPIPPDAPPLVNETGTGVPMSYITRPGDTLRNLIPRFYSSDPQVTGPNPDQQRIEQVATFLYQLNEGYVPYDKGIDTPLPGGIILTYYR